ncbi:GNAT family N-acetyltransferase [Streptococcus merionis]|uniref:GNAT family N-acetyltransferase n=1 Tax=Streptococcus merionis TaxID=400065 RepID=UPI003518B08A
MDFSAFSSYQVLDINDDLAIEKAYTICQSNPLYYDHCPPFVTKESLKETITYCPPDSGLENKHFFLLMEQDSPLAIVDLIESYPDPDTSWLGLFMVNSSYQGQGLGSQLVEELCDFLKRSGFQRLRLGWVKGNPQAEAFWLKNAFQVIEEKESLEGHHIVVAQRIL